MLSTERARRHGARCLSLLLPILALLAAPAAAREGVLLDRITITAGGFATEPDTEVRLDSPELGVGTRIDLEDDLGLSDSEDLVRLGVELRFARRHQINLGYYSLERSGASVIDTQIQFGDEVFPVEAEVAAFLDTEVLELSYTFWAYLTDRTAVGLNLGALALSADAGLAVAGEVVGGTVSDDASADVPVPLVGLELRQALTRRLAFLARGRFIDIDDIEGASGDAVDLRVAVEHRTLDVLGFGLAYNSLALDLELDDAPDFVGRLDYDIEGLELYLRLGF